MRTKEQKESAFHKIVKAINGCKTTEQVESCRNLISNYSKLFKSDFPDSKYEVAVLTEELIEKEKNVI